MTQDKIIQMARDSGMELYGLGKDRARFVHHLEAFAKLVAEKALAEHAMQEVQRLGQEIEQEPVAHCKVRPLRGDESFPKVEIDWVNQPVPGPLYTSPPQRQPLTDEQISTIVREAARGSAIKRDGSTSQRIARAIEAAHGIKENT